MTVLPKTIFLAALLAGCAAPAKRIPLPAEFIHIPIVVPLPKECGELKVLPLPAGTTAEQVMNAQNEVIRAYEDQIKRCMQAQVPQ